MRPVHYILLAIIAAVVAVGWFEKRPVTSDFDTELHSAFKKRWIAARRAHAGAVVGELWLQPHELPTPAEEAE